MRCKTCGERAWEGRVCLDQFHKDAEHPVVTNLKDTLGLLNRHPFS